jgi:hypothetical protein
MSGVLIVRSPSVAFDRIGVGARAAGKNCAQYFGAASGSRDELGRLGCRLILLGLILVAGLVMLMLGLGLGENRINR